MNAPGIVRLPWNAGLSLFTWSRDHAEIGARVFVRSLIASIITFSAVYTFAAYGHPGWLIFYIAIQVYLAIVASVSAGQMYAVVVGPIDIFKIIGKITTGTFGEGFQQADNDLKKIAGKATNIARWVILAEWLVAFTCVILFVTGVKKDPRAGLWMIGGSLLLVMAFLVPRVGHIPNIGVWNKRFIIAGIALAIYTVYTGTPYGQIMGLPMSGVLAVCALAVPIILGLLQVAGAIFTPVLMFSMSLWLYGLASLVFHNHVSDIKNAVAEAEVKAPETWYVINQTYGLDDDFDYILRGDKQDTLIFKPGIPLRRTRRSVATDPVDNLMYEFYDTQVTFQGDFDTLGHVPPHAGKCLVLARDISTEPIVGINHRKRMMLDWYAIWDQTQNPPEKVASFNPNIRPIAVEPNATLAHPLGDYHVGPSLYYGITQKWDSKTHWGDDFPCSPGDSVYAAADGIVIAIYPVASNRISGITIRHDLPNGTVYTQYFEVGRILVALGDKVTQGQVIARTDGRPSKPGASLHAREGHLHFEVWSTSQEYHAYIPVDPMTWISTHHKIPLGPKWAVAYPLYPLPGTEDEYEIPVNLPACYIAKQIQSGDEVSQQLLNPETAQYVINGTRRNWLWYQKPITVTGKAYPLDDRNISFRDLFRFYTDPDLASYGQMISGVNGFADAHGMGYGTCVFQAREDGWLYFGINEITGFQTAPDPSIDYSADNYTLSGRDVVRVKVTVRRHGQNI